MYTTTCHLCLLSATSIQSDPVRFTPWQQKCCHVSQAVHSHAQRLQCFICFQINHSSPCSQLLTHLTCSCRGSWKAQLDALKNKSHILTSHAARDRYTVRPLLQLQELRQLCCKGEIYSTASIAIARATSAMLQGTGIQYRLCCKNYISYAAWDRYTVPPLLQELHQICCKVLQPEWKCFHIFVVICNTNWFEQRHRLKLYAGLNNSPTRGFWKLK